MSKSPKPRRSGSLPSAAETSPDGDPKLWSTLEQRRAFDALAADMQQQAAAGEPASEAYIRLVSDVLVKQRQETHFLVHAPPLVRNLIHFFADDHLRILRQFPTQEQLSVAGAVASLVDILIWTYSQPRHP